MKDRSISKWRGLILITTAWSLLSPYGTGIQQGRDDRSPSEFLKVPPAARARTNPFVGNQDARRAGRKLFLRHCSACHGKDAKGGKDAPDLQSAPVRDASPGILFWFMKNGDLKNGMPSWSRLPEQQLWQIVTYLQSKNEPKP